MEADTSRSPASRSAGEPGRVLVVDDDEDSRSFLCLSLRDSGYECAEASSGECALELIESFAPHVFIIDLSMPGMSGIELGRRVRERCGKAARLIALTGHIDKKSRADTRLAGFDYHLPKPVLAAQLLPYIDEEPYRE